MHKLWILPAALGIGLMVLAGASAQTSRPVGPATTRPAMPPGPWGGMVAPGGGQGDGTADLKIRLASSDEEWKVIGPKLRKVMAARQAAEAAIDPTNPMAGGAFPGWPGRGPGGGFRPPGGPGFGPDSFSGPGGGGPPGGFGRPGGPSSRPANDQRPMGGPADAGPGAAPGPGPWPGAATRPATTRPAGGMAGQPGDFGPMPPWGFGPPPGGGFGPPPGGGFGPPPGFGGRGGPAMQALTELQAVLADAKATPDQIKDKLAAVRAARQKARAELAAAQKDLLELLTSDQEAVLVDAGMLD